MPAKSTKILFIITQSEMGGAQRFMLEFTTALNRSRFTPHIAAGPRGGWELLDRARQANIITHKLHALARAPMPWRWPALFRELRALVDDVQPDIIFLNSSTAGFLGSWAFRSSGRPIVYRIGGWAFNDPRPFWQSIPILWAERLSARWKDVIVVNSERDRTQARELSITPRRGIVTISNGLDADEINFFDRSEARAKLSEAAGARIDDDTLLLGNVANFYRSKSHDVLLRAFRRLQEKMQDTRYKSVTLILIGDGMLRPQIERLRRELSLEDSVLLAGQLPEARRYMKALDCFVLSSSKEGFPWTILEAAATPLPIVATDVSGVPDFVHNNKTGLIVPPQQPDALADALQSIVTDAVLREHLAQGAADELRSHFSKQTMVTTFERLFERLL